MVRYNGRGLGKGTHHKIHKKNNFSLERTEGEYRSTPQVPESMFHKTLFSSQSAGCGIMGSSLSLIASSTQYHVMAQPSTSSWLPPLPITGLKVWNSKPDRGRKQNPVLPNYLASLTNWYLEMAAGWGTGQEAKLLQENEVMEKFTGVKLKGVGGNIQKRQLPQCLLMRNPGKTDLF